LQLITYGFFDITIPLSSTLNEPEEKNMETKEVTITCPAPGRILKPSDESWELRTSNRTELQKEFTKLIGLIPQGDDVGMKIIGYYPADEYAHRQKEVARVEHGLDDDKESWETKLRLFLDHVDQILTIEITYEESAATIYYILGN
jgi:virulence-associated protein VagC